MYNQPLAYFLTFTTYGTWLPGDERGFMEAGTSDRPSQHRVSQPKLLEHATKALAGAPRLLNEKQRVFVDDAIREACVYREWPVHALNVRSNHVHLVVSSRETPEATMRKIKARVTKAMREARFLGSAEKLWTRHGSTVYLFNQQQFEHAVRYTLEAQEGARFEIPE